MNRSESESLIVKMKQLWGNPFKVTSNTAMEWAQRGDDIEYSSMARAIDSFADKGDKFPPSLAEVVSCARGYRQRVTYDPNLPKCDDCGGPTETRKAHFSFCKTHGNGKFVIETTEEYLLR